MGEAEVEEGAIVATGFVVLRGRGGAVSKESGGAFDDLKGEGAEVFVDGNGGAPSGFSVEDESLGYFGLEHFLKAKSLGADLDLISAVGFWFAAFVFNGSVRAVVVLFDDVADSAEVVSFRTHPELSQDGTGGAVFVGAFVGFFMKLLSLGGETILGPDLLVVDEGALARAIQEVLQRGEWDGFGRGRHGLCVIDCMHIFSMVHA